MTAYTAADGLASAECNGGTQPAGCRTHDGLLWFPTIKGVAVVDPQDLRKNMAPPPVRVEELLAAGHSVPIAQGIALPPGTRNLEIRYAALSFLAPERVLFRYKLDGYDEQWVDAGGRRSAFYTALPPGRYRFKVEACNNDGVWNRTGADLEFEMQPRLYQTWPFRAAALIGLGVAVYGLFRLRVRTLKARQRQLEKVIDQRTGELKQANLDLERIARQDGLTGLANHRTFHEKLDEEWRRCVRAKDPLSLLVIDIDHFKPYNDAHGHLEGDACLKRVAEAISGQVRRPTDLTARYGGEEFAVILSMTEADGALYVAQKQRAAVEDIAVPHGASPVSPYVTISVGVATAIPTKDESPEGLLSRRRGVVPGQGRGTQPGGCRSGCAGLRGIPGNSRIGTRLGAERLRSLEKGPAFAGPSIVSQ